MSIHDLLHELKEYYGALFRDKKIRREIISRYSQTHRFITHFEIEGSWYGRCPECELYVFEFKDGQIIKHCVEWEYRIPLERDIERWKYSHPELKEFREGIYLKGTWCEMCQK